MRDESKKPVGGDMVSVMRDADPVRVRQIVALLEDSGIVCATPGLEHRSAIGIAGPYLLIEVLVGESDAERAREILEALESGEVIDEEPDDEEESEPPPEDPKATYRRAARKRVEPDHDARPVGDIRLRRVAAFAAFVFPGGAHLYTRQYWRALAVFVLYPVALFAGPDDVPFRLLPLLTVVATDVVGASYWADVSQGRISTSLRRHTVPFGIIGVPVLIYLLAHPLSPVFAGPRGRAYCEAIAACGDDRDACMRQAALVRGTTYDIGARCVACVEGADCDFEGCADACEW